MNNFPKKTAYNISHARPFALFLCFIVISFFLNLSCNKDEESSIDNQARNITNKAPVAKIYVSKSENLDVSNLAINGIAPLSISFRSVSYDDYGIKGYTWDFGNGIAPSKLKETKRTFNYPGVYNVKLTVRDAEGLTSTDSVKVTLTGKDCSENTELPQIKNTANIDCSVGGARADETGAKIWCWDDITVPSGESSGINSFSDGQLAINLECSANQVVREGNRLKFQLNPTHPAPAGWCNNDFNIRAEISTMPWNVDHPVGTEEWFGWSYTFGNNYVINHKYAWPFFQIHEGTIGESPLISLQVNGDQAGEINIVNASQSGPYNTYSSTGIIPTACQTVDIVLHIIWGDDANGLLQVWMNDNKVYDAQVRTVRASTRVGGNAKFGIYYSPWRNATSVQASAEQGITQVETYMGTLRMITRRPGDPDYGKNSYSEVAPD